MARRAPVQVDREQTQPGEARRPLRFETADLPELGSLVRKLELFPGALEASVARALKALGDPRLRLRAATFLARAGRLEFARWSGAVTAERRELVRADLLQLRPHDAPSGAALEFLLSLALGARSSLVRAAAVDALPARCLDEEALRRVADLLSEESCPSVRTAVIRCLGRRPGSMEAIDRLLLALACDRRESIAARHTAIVSLRELERRELLALEMPGWRATVRASLAQADQHLMAHHN